MAKSIKLTVELDFYVSESQLDSIKTPMGLKAFADANLGQHNFNVVRVEEIPDLNEVQKLKDEGIYESLKELDLVDEAIKARQGW